MSIALTHKNPTYVPPPPIVYLRLIMGQSRALTLSKLYVIVLNHMIQNHNFRTKSHRSKCRNPNLANPLENLRPGIFGIVFGETTIEHSLCARVIIFFPGIIVTWLERHLWFKLVVGKKITTRESKQPSKRNSAMSRVANIIGSMILYREYRADAVRVYNDLMGSTI